MTPQQQAMVDALRRRAGRATSMGAAPADMNNPQAPPPPKPTYVDTPLGPRQHPDSFSYATPGVGAATGAMDAMGLGQYAPEWARPPAATPSDPRLQASGNIGIRQPGTGNPNTQQMSAAAQAMFDEMRRRNAREQAQKMVDERGVFAGQQQGQAMPGLPNGGVLPSLFG